MARTPNRAREEIDEDDDRPVKKGKSAPARDDDDEDDRPAKKSKPAARDDDDEDEDRPAPKKSSKAASRNDDDDNDGDGDGDSNDPDGPINLSEASDEARAYEVLPAGKYQCQIDEVEYVTFKSGTKGLKIKLEVTEGEHAAGGKRKKGAVFFTNLVVSAKAADLLKSGLKAIGVDKKVYNHTAFKPSMLQKIADSGDLIGNEVVADVKIRVYEGDKRNEVRRLLAPGAGGKVAGKGDFMED